MKCYALSLLAVGENKTSVQVIAVVISCPRAMSILSKDLYEFIVIN